MVLILWNSFYESRYFYHINEIINYVFLEEEDRYITGTITSEANC